MATGFNSDAKFVDWSTAISNNADLQERAWSHKLHLDACSNDDLSAFESAEVKQGSKAAADPSTPRGIFVRKTDFQKLGGDRMTFTVMGPPAGPGVKGSAELTGSTSTPNFATYDCVVDWRRDAVEYDKKHRRQFATKDQLISATQQGLSEKFGRWRQREMLLYLRRYANGNKFLPNGKLTVDSLEGDDTLTPTVAEHSKVRATMLGARPLMNMKTRFGGVHESYLLFGSEESLLGVRDDTGYQNALQNANIRGDGNPLFTGRLVPYQGVHFFNHKVVNPGWNDVIGSPLNPRAVLLGAFSTSSAAGDVKLTGGTEANTSNLYFWDFPGLDYLFTEKQAASADSDTYYAWIVNPDGSLMFVSYVGSGNNGNEITITNVLATAAGTSTKGSKTVGGLSLGTTPTVSSNVITPDADANVPSGYTYTDAAQAGATIILANRLGTPIGYSFLLGAMTGVRGYGQQDMQIEQERDYRWIKGFGFEGCWGQSLCKRSDDVTNGYQLVVHAYTPEGYNIPTVSLEDAV